MPSTNLYHKRKLSLKITQPPFFLFRTSAMNPEGSVFFKGGKENSHLYIYLQLTHFVRHVQGIKLGTHTHTHLHTRTSYHIK